jgi:hypothetical protein
MPRFHIATRFASAVPGYFVGNDCCQTRIQVKSIITSVYPSAAKQAGGQFVG